jgi:phosphatidylglycerophosphatase A
VNRLKLGLVSCGYLGLAPVAPGTFGTLGGVAIAACLVLAGATPFAAWALGIALAVYAVGWALAPWAEAYAGRKDPGIFVLDEVVGYLVTVAIVPRPGWLTLVVGFFVFRLFDVLKPWPARALERIRGGHGIILDDVAAGLYGCLVLWAAGALLPGAPWSHAG